jgi:uncharacterized RDD family membrane protein YckC
VTQSASPGAQAMALPYAGFWIRFAAWLIDAVITYIGGAILGFIIGFIAGILGIGIRNQGGVSAFANVLTEIAALVLAWLYYALLQSSSYQASVGQMLVGLSVVGYDGRRISFGRATGRYFASLISWFCFIGYVMIAFTERKQALHDLIASTLVLRGRPQPGTVAQPLPGAAAGAGAAVGIAVGAVAIVLLAFLLLFVIVLTMGAQIANVFSNVVVALGTG